VQGDKEVGQKSVCHRTHHSLLEYLTDPSHWTRGPSAEGTRLWDRPSYGTLCRLASNPPGKTTEDWVFPVHPAQTE
jgi:hypothetical protein